MKKRLGKLELEVMKLIWDKGQATIREVWEELYPEKKLAYTTVATVMKQLEGKKFLNHSEKERTYIYHPAVDQKSISQGLLKELIDGLFDGSAANLITALVQGDQITEDDLEEIQQIILKHRNSEVNGNG